jgi:hypothetical protein
MADDQDAPLYLAWLLLHERQFSADNGPGMEAEDYPASALRGLVMLARDQAVTYRRLTTRQTIEAAPASGWNPKPYGTDIDAMLDVYDRLDAFEVDEASLPRISELCLKWLRMRRMGRALDEAADHLRRGKEEEAGASLGLARQAVLGQTEETLTLSDIPELYRDLGAPIPTGIGFIDRAWKGGIRPHELAVLFSSTNLGKSMSLCAIALNAFRENRKVLMYTFELTPRQVLGRIVAGILRRSLDDVPEAEAVAFVPMIKKRLGIDRGDIKIRTGRKSVADLTLDLEQLRRDGWVPELILLDSADDLIVEHSSRQDWLDQGKIYEGLRHFVVREGVPLWTSTQADRTAVEKARISLKNIGRSFIKAQRAHFVVALAQTEEQRLDPAGPLMSVMILKDSEWGSPGKWKELKVFFGSGSGWPQFADPDEDGGLSW